ncbi:hypothetical protein JI721_12390 [Alicyclobacillus cycloheptanicus]|uniref:Uncharacterized protein n=1 Tax=Alicyclobacillus cycloheptanicus TaxID=1457 RepID=A0ABT9XEX3_9BACL|nr:hypothetical protein [Alicyclobacillus cycloheptanicus]MDQ0188845.1 hypothetical protein [Alicyclobacillus cycloheptanicus]WDM00509.1 hypothetical protein JI721_12390 [Alicyclobacillus cycloheptanicus]
MDWSKETAKVYVGQWVHCHSVYGMHQGMVHRALRDGIILVQHIQLADGAPCDANSFEPGVYAAGDDRDIQPAQFLAAPGLFIPYRGLFGLWPVPFFPI